jgi:hypothetical protein
MIKKEDTYKNKEDKYFKGLLSNLEKYSLPSRKFKDDLFSSISGAFDLNEQKILPSEYTLLERIFFEKPWRIVFPLSLIVSIIFKLAAGSMFDKFVFALFAGI